MPITLPWLQANVPDVFTMNILSCGYKNIFFNLSTNTSLKGFTVWKEAHRGPPPSSFAHRAITVRRAPPPLMGHLALLVQRGNNWVRQVGQHVRDAEKDASVLQVSLSTNTPNSTLCVAAED